MEGEGIVGLINPIFCESKEGLCGNPNPVQYQKEYPNIDFFKSFTEERTKRSLLTKTEEWKYEKEWRIFNSSTLDKGGNVPLKFPESALIGVIFGLKTKETDKQKIREWIKPRKSPIQLYQARKKTKRVRH